MHVLPTHISHGKAKLYPILTLKYRFCSFLCRGGVNVICSICSSLAFQYQYLQYHWLHACAFAGRTWDCGYGQNRKARQVKRTAWACVWLCYLIAHWKCLHCHSHTHTLYCGKILKNDFGKTSWIIDFTPNGPSLKKVTDGVKGLHLIGAHISACVWLVHTS